MGNSAQTNTANNTATNSATNANSATNYGSNTGSNTAQTSNYSSATGPSAAGQALINQATNPSNTISNISSFMSPYTQSVLNSQVALQNQQDAQQQSQLSGNAASAGALGGDRAVLAGASLAGQQALANNAANSQTLQAGYGQALNAAQQTAGQQLQGAGLSGTQTAGGQQSAGSTASSTLGGTQSSQNSATAGTSAGTGSSTTTQIPGLASNIGLGVGLLGMLKDGGRVDRADGGRASIGGIQAFDNGGGVAGQFVFVPGQNGAPGQYVWVPAQSGQGQGGGQGAGQGANASPVQQGAQQAKGIGEMYQLGQKARQGLGNLFDSMGSGQGSGNGAISKLFGSSSTPTIGDGGWSTGTQTSGLVGSGGIGNSVSNLGSSISSGASDLGSSVSSGLSSLGSSMGFAKGGSTSAQPSTAFFNGAPALPALSVPGVSAPNVSMPNIPAPNVPQAAMPSVSFPYVPTAHTSSGKGSGGAVRGFAAGGDADFNDSDADYTIGDAFKDGDSALLKPSSISSSFLDRALAKQSFPSGGISKDETAPSLLSAYQNAQGNVYPPAVYADPQGPVSLGTPEHRRFPDEAPAPATPQDILRMLANENSALKDKLSALAADKAAQPSAAASTPHVDEDAGRDVAASGFMNPLPAEALRGPVFRSDASNLSSAPASTPTPVAPSANTPWQTSVEGASPAPSTPAAPSEAPEGGYLARAIRDFHPLDPLEKLRQLLNPDPTEYPGAKWGPAIPDAPRKPKGEMPIAESPTADWAGAFGVKPEAKPNLSAAPQLTPDNTPLPARRPANLGQPVIPPSIAQDAAARADTVRKGMEGMTTDQPPPGTVIKGNTDADISQVQGGSPTLAQPIPTPAPLSTVPAPADAVTQPTDVRPPVMGGKRGVVQSVVQEARANGMSDNAIRGLLANVKDESGFDPGLRHPDQPKWGGEAHYAHGLFQEGGAEWNHYVSWLKQNAPNGKWDDPQLQTRFLAQNLQQNYPAVWKAMNEGTPEDAAQAFVSGYLRPARQFEDARSAQYGRGVPQIEDFVNGAVGGIKSGINTIGGGIQSAGEGVSHTIGGIADHIRGFLGGQSQNPQHDAGLFQSLFGVNPFNMSDDSRNRLMRAATLVSAYGANKLPEGLEHIQELDVKQKAAARQAQHDAQTLQMELAKMAETSRHNQVEENLPKNRFTPGYGIDPATGQQVMGSYSTDKDGNAIFHANQPMFPRGAGSAMGGGHAGGVYEVKRQAYLAVHKGDEQGALEYASGHKSMSDTDVQKAAAQLAQKDAATEGVMGQKYKPYIEERTKFWSEALRHGSQAAAAPQQAAPAQQPAPTQSAAPAPVDHAQRYKQNPAAAIADAQSAVKRGADPAKTEAMLKSYGIPADQAHQAIVAAAGQ
jgi:hypothetical protein